MAHQKQEDNGTRVLFNLYAVHHEKAKLLLRLSLFHFSDQELVDLRPPSSALRVVQLYNRPTKQKRHYRDFAFLPSPVTALTSSKCDRGCPEKDRLICSSCTGVSQTQMVRAVTCYQNAITHLHRPTQPW